MILKAGLRLAHQHDMTPERLQLAVREQRTDATAPQVQLTPPSAARAREARQLVESWLATSFIARGDAVEDLIARIAWRLGERDALACRFHAA